MFRTLALCFSLFVALSACGESNVAKQDLKSAAGEKPDAPNELKAVAADTKVTLNWNVSARALSYKVWRGEKTGGPYGVLVAVPVTTAYTDETVENGKTYFYVVQGVNEAGASANSAEASATPLGPIANPQPPAAPGSLAATVLSATQIGLAWSDNSTNENGFKVERKTGAGGTYAVIATLGANAVSYTNTGLTASTQYYYRVYAYNTAGDSVSSNEVNATTQAAPVAVPTAPSSLVAVAASDTQINLTWTDNATAEDGFKVERKTGSGGTYAVIAALGANAASYSNTGLAASTQYYYRVFAYNTVGDSVSSNEANATTQAPAVSGAMAAIAGGTFSMGDALGDGGSNELPVHSVTLSAFEMDVKEVSNAEYKACVTAGACTAPGFAGSYNRASYYGAATYDAYPVIYVDWTQASTYCTWAGKRLPTEAEWEYAARGGLAGKRFPWGDTIDCTQANYYTTDYYAYDVDPFVGEKFCSSDSDTSAGGSYGANGYGLYDMAGNVWEWVNDWYGSYSAATVTNPTGPATGTYRVLRGGGFSHDALTTRVSYRGNGNPTSQGYFIGFRCAR